MGKLLDLQLLSSTSSGLKGATSRKVTAHKWTYVVEVSYRWLLTHCKASSGDATMQTLLPWLPLTGRGTWLWK